jgi:cytoskeletal protein CcmA (bactofilin family)
MFGKKRKKRRKGGGGLTLLTEGTSVQGELVAEGDMRIDGSVTGNVTCKATLVIGSEGSVEGEIKAGNMRIAGKFKGNADLAGELCLEQTAVIDGDLTVAAIDVEDGAKLNGRVFMKESEEPGERQKEDAPEPGFSGVKP